MALRTAPSVLRVAPSVLRTAPSVLRVAPLALRTAPSVLRVAPLVLRVAPLVLFDRKDIDGVHSPQVGRGLEFSYLAEFDCEARGHAVEGFAVDAEDLRGALAVVACRFEDVEDVTALDLVEIWQT